MTQSVFISLSEIDSILAGRIYYMTVFDKPMSLVRMSDNKQIAVNQMLLDELETKAEIAVNRDMTGFWLPEVKAQLDRRLANERSFTWTYEASLGRRYAQLTAHFEVFADSRGTSYRQVTLLEKPIEKEMPLEIISAE